MSEITNTYIKLGFNNNNSIDDTIIIKNIPFSLASRSSTIKNMLSDFNLIELDNTGNIISIKDTIDGESYHMFLPQNYITKELIDKLIEWDKIKLTSNNSNDDNDQNNISASSFIILENIESYKHTINNLFKNSNNEEINFITNLDEKNRNNLLELTEHLDISEFSDILASYYALDIIKILKEKNYKLFKTKYNFIDEDEVKKETIVTKEDEKEKNYQ